MPFLCIIIVIHKILFLRTMKIALICSIFAMFLALIFSHFLYLSYFMFFLPYVLKLLSFLFPLFITISLLFLALALRYCNSFLLSTCMPNETKYKQCIPLLGEGMEVEVLPTFMLEAKTKVDFPGKSTFDVLKVEEEVDISVEFEEEFTENVALCVQAHDKIIEDNVINGGGSNFVGVSLNVGTNEAMRKETEWKKNIALLEQHDVTEGEDRMDSLWEIDALLDTYQSDSTTKPAPKAAVVVEKKKKKRTRKLDYYGKEEDDVQMRTGCLPFKCCARKMNLGMGRNQIVRITRPLKRIDWFPLHHVMKRRAWQKGQILI